MGDLEMSMSATSVSHAWIVCGGMAISRSTTASAVTTSSTSKTVAISGTGAAAAGSATGPASDASRGGVGAETSCRAASAAATVDSCTAGDRRRNAGPSSAAAHRMAWPVRQVHACVDERRPASTRSARAPTGASVPAGRNSISAISRSAPRMRSSRQRSCDDVGGRAGPMDGGGARGRGGS